MITVKSIRTASLKALSGTRNIPPLVILAPALLVGSALILPLVYLSIRTFATGESDVLDVLFRQRIADIIGRTIVLVISVTIASTILAVPIAWLTTRTDIPFRRAWVVLSVLPLVIPTYVAGFVVVAALGPKGMLQKALEGTFGIDRLPDIHGFPGAFLTLTFLSFPYIVLTVRGAMLRIDPAMEESSRSLGRGKWSTFACVTLPLLRPGITAGGLLVALYTLSDFGAVSLLRYETFTWAIFIQYESALDRTLGAGLSLVLVVFALMVVGLEFVSRGRARYHSSTSSVSRPLEVVRLGQWRWIALLFCFSVVMASLAMPMSILGYWVVRGVSAGESLNFAWAPIGNSFYISALAATIVLVASLPVATLSVRYPSPLSGLLERVGYISFALPGIAVALALVFFGARYASALYQTTSLLLLAYLILYISPALGSVRSSLLQISPRIEEAARGLGNSPIRTFSSVTLPIARPGLLAGWALVFLLVMKELPATLILSPVGFDTLATSIWSAASEAFFARAAAPALLLIAVSAVPLSFLMLRERH